MKTWSLRIAPALLVLPLLASSSAAWAAEHKLAWDPPSTNADGTPVTDLLGYKLYYGSQAGPPFNGTPALKEGPSPITILASSLADPQKPSFRVTGIPSCTRMYYALTAYNSTSESDFSNRVDRAAAYAPKVTLSATGGGIAVSWTSPPQDDTGAVHGYGIHFGIRPGAPYEGVAVEGNSPLNVPATTTSFGLTGLPPSTYYVAVESLCLDGGELSDEVRVVLGGGIPGDGGGRPSDGSIGPARNARTQCSGSGCAMSTSTPSRTSPVLYLALLLLLAWWRRPSR